MAEHFTRFTKKKYANYWPNSKNSKKITRRTTSAIRRIYAELNDPLSPKLADKRTLSEMNLTSMEVSLF